VHVVVMPKLGLTMQEAELVGWLVDVGGAVRAGEPLCEVETDKITMEVESPADGVLLRRVEAGEVVAVGVGIGVVGEAGEDAAMAALHGDATSPRSESQHESHFDSGDDRGSAVGGSAASSSPTDGGSVGRRPVAPVARRLAEELGVDLATVTGTGPGGRIVRRDVEAAAGISPTEDDDG
jgi:pyruvate dehydrogenase E2 component (dihydrolipoyllysine-residue acetyltransferase)